MTEKRKVHWDFATQCGNCGHTFPTKNGEEPYTCPACDAGPPHTATYSPFHDASGNIIAPAVVHRLVALGVLTAEDVAGVRYVPHPNGVPYMAEESAPCRR